MPTFSTLAKQILTYISQLAAGTGNSVSFEAISRHFQDKNEDEIKNALAELSGLLLISYGLGDQIHGVRIKEDL